MCNYNILIIGYGKVGSIKSDIYKSLGCNVFIVDPYKTSSKYKILKTIPKDSNIDICDICTPTDRHIQDVQSVLNIAPKAKIFVEKPLCNNKKDYAQFQQILKDFPLSTILLSENYLYSSVMKEVKNFIIQNDIEIKSIEIEFSKDRRQDVQNGRFIDQQLGPIGIEVPHMISLLYSLGINNIKAVSSTHNFLNDDGDFFFQGVSNNTQVLLYQSLKGTYRTKDKNFIIPGLNEIQSYRVLKLSSTQGDSIYVQFDPIPGFPRYQSRMIFESNNAVIKQITLQDDHLKQTIQTFLKEDYQEDFIENNHSFLDWQSKNLFKLTNL
jgi:hypothetical protein